MQLFHMQMQVTHFSILQNFGQKVNFNKLIYDMFIGAKFILMSF